jgi:tRNA nucleotidyltransferase (CCA-adding enzyme)
MEMTRDLEKAGFQVWAVGGAVRDALIGHAHLDWDLATDATPDQVRTVFGRKRTIPVGIEFGTVKVLDANGVAHEITTFRRDVKTDGRHAEVEFGASLDEDLARRDFTINAVAYSPTRGEVHDPFGGQKDLAARIVRAVGEPAARMREDYLRALRAIRFAARFDFEIDPRTWTAIRESAPHLTRLSAERVKQELEKTMDQVDAPSRALRLWRESGAVAVLIPELSNASDETLRAVDFAARPGPPRRPGRRLIRLATLFCDMSANEVSSVANRLRFSKNDGKWLSELNERWCELDAPMAAALLGKAPDPAQVRRWIARIGRTRLSSFFRLAAARWEARREAGGRAPDRASVHALYRRASRVALTEPLDLNDLAIDGDDLRTAGIQPGPWVGKILSALLELVLTDPTSNSRERLLTEARRVHSQGGNTDPARS